MLACLALSTKAGLGASTGLKVAMIVVAAIVQIVLPLLGHKAMLRILRMLVGPFILLAIFALPKAHLGAGSNANFATVMIALALILAVPPRSRGGHRCVLGHRPDLRSSPRAFSG